MRSPEILKYRMCFIWLVACCFLAPSVFASTDQDTIPPILLNPAMTQTVSCSDMDLSAFDAWYLSAGGAIASDNSDTFNFVGIPDFSTSRADFIASSDTLCGNSKGVSVTFFAQDTCGNNSIGTVASFFSVDTLRPFLITEAQSITLACGEGIRDSLNQYIQNAGGAEASDNCSDTILLTNFFWNDSNGNGGVGTIDNGTQIPISRNVCDWSVTLSFLLSDECGNIIATTSSFTIIDTIAPVFDTLPPDITVQCDQVPVYNVAAFDACDLEILVTATETSTQSSDNMSCDFYNYTINRSWSASDVCGNMISHSQRVTVVDTLAPSFTIPPDLSVDCTDLDDLQITLGPIDLVEPCGVVNSSFTDSIIGVGCSYEVQRSWLVSDPCGNDSSFVQILTVTDSTGPTIIQEAQDLVLYCGDMIDYQQSFLDWIDSMGGSSVTDLCGNFDMFSALSGTYMLEDSTTYPGTMPMLGSSLQCFSSSNGTVDSLLIDFVYYDFCGNATLSQASFIVRDTIAPNFTEAKRDTTIITDPMDCSGTFELLFPSFSDNCLFDESIYQETITTGVTSASSGTNDTVIDTVYLDFTANNSFINPATGNIQLEIFLENLDTDDPNEIFYLVDENDVTLDSTIITNTQCSDQLLTVNTITVTMLNAYAADGLIQFRLIPKLDPAGAVFSINDVCDFSMVRGELVYDIMPSAAPRQLVFVDHVPVSLDTTSSVALEEGVHAVEYQIIDCGGNVATLTQQVIVVDGVAPVITCPADTILYVGDSLCEASYLLPDRLVVTDNCNGEQEIIRVSPESQSDRLIRFIPNVTLGTDIASNRQFIFDSIAPIQNSLIEPRIEVFINGDINDIGEFYSILGEDGNTIVATAIAANQACGTSLTSTIFTIPIDQFNNWASDSILILSAVSNIDPSVDGGGINPCGILSTGMDTDGISELWARLTYDDYELEYKVEGASNISRVSIADDSLSRQIDLRLGQNEITYFAQDASANEDSCSFLVTVLDTFAPVVNCQDFVAFIHPSGLIDYVLAFDSLDVSSGDNCMLTDTILSRDIFTCDDVGNEYDITVILGDASANRDSCTSRVRVEMSVLTPTFTTGVCEDDTLKLFANVPAAPIANAYTFSWAGPNGFVSSLENPFILNADDSFSGTYTLEVRGFNGCLSTGSVVVNVEQLVTPTVSPNAPQVCVDDEVLLTTNSFSGDLEYKWYEGQFPNGVLLQTTQNASLVLSPTVGEHFYYVIIESDNCVTNASASIMVSVLDPPIATVLDPFLSLCQGDDLVLGTDEFNPFYEYFWSGPDDYSSMGQFPEVIEGIDIDQQGPYSLVIRFGSCVSDTANTQVVIFDKPITPQITSDGLFCEGSTIVMSVNNITSADQYTWINDGQVFTNTNVNTLVLTGAQTSFGGEWQVFAREGICDSDTSAIEIITVEEEIQIGATNDGPACEGDSIQLTASLIPNAMYSWESPIGDTLTTQNPKVPAQQGTYILTVTTASGCESITSTIVDIATRPTITALSSNATDCVEPGQDIQFFPSIFPDGNYDYIWTGPIPLGNEKNPIITAADGSASGIYSLTVMNGNCESNTLTLTLDINSIPEQAVIIAPSLLCEGDSILLSLEEDYDATFEFEWNTPNGLIITSTDTLLISAASMNDIGSYSVTIINGDCRSVLSQATSIDIIARPATPTIASIGSVCLGESISIAPSSFIEGATYFWEGPNGLMNSDSVLILDDLSMNDSGSYILTLSLNDCLSLSSNSIDLDINELPTAPLAAEDSYVRCLTETDPLVLCIDPSSFVSGLSYVLSIDGQNITTTMDSCYLLDIASFDIGSYVISWEALAGDCVSDPSEQIPLFIEDEEEITGNIIADNLELCSGESVTLEAIGFPESILYSWSSSVAEISFSQAEASTTEVTGLEIGSNIIYLNADARICGNSFMDSIIIEVIPFPDAAEDSYTLAYNQGEFLNILENDNIDRNFSFEIIQDVTFGSIEYLNGIIRFTSDERFIEEQIFIYEICYDECPDHCDQAAVSLLVDIDLDCAVPSIITPNEDGINDAMVIPCLNANFLTDNELLIFNQYGDEVFGAKPYTNNWEGTYNGQPLPVGTYYYVFDRGDGSRPLNGFIMIQR